jgi:hypothetical protein
MLCYIGERNAVAGILGKLEGQRETIVATQKLQKISLNLWHVGLTAAGQGCQEEF